MTAFFVRIEELRRRARNISINNFWILELTYLVAEHLNFINIVGMMFSPGMSLLSSLKKNINPHFIQNGFYRKLNVELRFQMNLLELHGSDIKITATSTVSYFRGRQSDYFVEQYYL